MSHPPGTQSGAEWEQATLSSLIQHILDTHHSYLREALPKIAGLCQTAGEATIGGALEGLRDEIESHLWKEEMVLFPLIRSLEAASEAGRAAPPSHCGSVQNPIRVMEQEHAGAKQALARLRELTGDYGQTEARPLSAELVAELARLDEDLHRHIHLEDDILFPRAITLEAGLAR
jgi:regulator of cell morphogenesis and NO signaling